MEVFASATPAVTAGTILGDALRRTGQRPILLMLSGGSAFTMLAHVAPAVLGPRMTITMLDERYATDPTINNFAQLQATEFFAVAVRSGVEFLPTTIESTETLAAAGARVDRALREWQDRHPEGVIVATMGIGPDGHTAGLFPGEHDIDLDGSDQVVAYQVPASVNPYQERITVSYTFLRTQVTTAIVYAVGAEKRAIVAQLQRSRCDRATLPACILRDMPQVTIVTDVPDGREDE